MRHIFYSTILTGVLMANISTPFVYAQQNRWKLSGSVMTDWLTPQSDDAIGANTDDYGSDLLGNTYINLNLDSRYLKAGLRFETMENPLPGFINKADTKSFAGTGLPYFQVTATDNRFIEGTVGTFYEQFGSGFILRAYEERSLGVDNSLLGGRLVLTPYKGIRLKMLGGIQRYHFSWNDESPIFGADLELNIDQWSKKLQDKGHYLTLGISGVVKHEGDASMTYTENSTTSVTNPNTGIAIPVIQTTPYTLHFPEDVRAMDIRLQWQHNGWNILGEYAVKSEDPINGGMIAYTDENGNKMNVNRAYYYHPGHVGMLSASYSRSGFSALVQAKRSDNMNFRSRRSVNPTVASLYINHQPAFAYQHTYSLAALYPYATQMDGEWAFQGELTYKFKRKTPLGGKYGTLLRLNISHIRGLEKTYDGVAKDGFLNLRGTDGYTTSFFGMTDDVYYQDINLTMEKKLNKSWKLTTMYMFQEYNQEVIEGHGVNGDIVRSHIFVADASYTHSANLSLRFEGQYLTTHQDLGDWAYLGAEVSFMKHWMVALTDQYNTGLNGGKDVHYYNTALVWTMGSSRLQAGYGRTRAGLNCTGGVCRLVPASRGFTLSWNMNF